MSVEIVLVGLIVVLLGYAMVRALIRMGWLGKTERKVSSGMASFLGELDHMLNPQRPSVEDIQHARDDDADEDDDEGDRPDPDEGGAGSRPPRG